MTPHTPQPDRPRRGHRQYHGRHRSRHDDLAHALDAGAAEADIPQGPLIPANRPGLIESPAELRELIDHLRTERRFAYDSEFIGEQSYFPRLCVIQVATAQRVALIDPYAAGLDLSPFWTLLADASIEKVVHAGLQDLEPVVRHTAQVPANVFDTQIAAGFAALGYPVGLSRLVRELVGVELGKGPKFSQWDRRPLTPLQLRYAADDVRYLVALRAAMAERLEALGNTAWASEECAALSEPRLYAFDPQPPYVRLRSAESLDRRSLAVLRELVRWRDAAAQERDVPPRTLLKDEVLVDLARAPVRSAAELARVRGLPRPVEEACGPQIVARIQRGLALPAAELPALHDETRAQRRRADELWARLQQICLARSIDPKLVASRREVGRVFRALARATPDAAVNGRLLRGWRRELLGDAIQRALAEMD